MVALVERGADEVVHAGIHDLEGLGAAFFLIQAAGEQHAGIADDVAPGL